MTTATQNVNANAAELKEILWKAHDLVEKARNNRSTQQFARSLEEIEGMLKELWKQVAADEHEEDLSTGYYDADGYHPAEKPVLNRSLRAADSAVVRRMQANADRYNRESELGRPSSTNTTRTARITKAENESGAPMVSRLGALYFKGGALDAQVYRRSYKATRQAPRCSKGSEGA